MSDPGSEADPSGLLNPYKKRVATGPSPPNQPESTTIVFPGHEHPRRGTPDVYVPEKDKGHQGEGSRQLTPESSGVTVNVQEGPVKWSDTRRKRQR